MAIWAKDSGGGDFTKELPRAGMHDAVYERVIDIGEQEETWEGQTNIRHKILVFWSIDQTISEGEYAGKRMLIKKKYTLSMSEKASLRRDLESRRGRAFSNDEVLKGFDLEKLRGVPCQLNILIDSYNGREYAKVINVLPPSEKGSQMLPELAEDWDPPQYVKDLIENGWGAKGDVTKKSFEPEDVPF